MAPAKTGDMVPGPSLGLSSVGERAICVGASDVPAPAPRPNPQTYDASLLSHAESVPLALTVELAQSDEGGCLLMESPAQWSEAW